MNLRNRLMRLEADAALRRASMPTPADVPLSDAESQTVISRFMAGEGLVAIHESLGRGPYPPRPDDGHPRVSEDELREGIRRLFEALDGDEGDGGPEPDAEPVPVGPPDSSECVPLGEGLSVA